MLVLNYYYYFYETWGKMNFYVILSENISKKEYFVKFTVGPNNVLEDKNQV